METALVEALAIPETLEEAIEAAIDRGIVLIEREYGPDWYRRVDADRLRLDSAGSCVLGQLETDWHDADPEANSREDFSYGDPYGHATLRFGLEKRQGDYNEKAAVTYGFLCGYLPYDGTDEDGRQRHGYSTYEELTPRWRARIRELLAAGGKEV